MECDFRSKRSEWLVTEITQMNAASVSCVSLDNYKVELRHSGP